MKKYLVLLAPDSAPGAAAQEDGLKKVRAKLERMNNTELEKYLHEATEALRENPEDEEAQAAFALIEEIMLKPKQTIKARAKNAVMIDGKSIAKDQVLMLTPQQFGAHAVNLVKVAAAIALMALLTLFVPAAKAQQYQNPFLALTNGSAINWDGATTNCILAIGGTRNINVVIPVTKWEKIGLSFNTAAMAASTSNNVWQVDISPDGTNSWSSFATITYPDTGTTPTGVFTNLNTGSAGYIRITSWASTTALVAKTNGIVKYTLKPSLLGN